MNGARLKLTVAVLLGLSAPLWWTWLVGQATHAMYVAAGSPEQATRGLLWGSVYMPSFILGVLAGVLASVLSPSSPLTGWVAFFLALLLSTLGLGLYLGEPITQLRSLYGSVGNILFIAGSLVWPTFAQVRKRAV